MTIVGLAGSERPGFWYSLAFAVATMSLLAFSIEPAQAQFSQTGAKLVGSGATSYPPQQGASVALSADGNTAIVGAPYDGPDSNSPIGAAWVYTRTNGVWTQQGAKLVATGYTGYPHLGVSVALSADGNTAIVGGTGDNNSMGAAWVFTRAGGVWTQQGAKLSLALSGTPYQGASVALSGDGNTALVGVPYYNSFVGTTLVYTRSGSTWTFKQLLAGTGYSTQSGGPNQGFSVALSADGRTAISGGPYDGSNGAAWVFTCCDNTGKWVQVGAKLVGSNAGSGSRQGWSVALAKDGNTALVGGVGDSGAGATWVFANSGGAWTQQGQKLVGSGADNNVNAWQGSSVALSADGNTAVIGGRQDATYIGATWVFTRSNGVWSQQGSKQVGSGANNTGGGAQLGASVALSADGATELVGGPMDAGSVGAVWTFAWPRWNVAATADFNGDGKTDLVFAQGSGSGVLADWLMNGVAAPTAHSSFGNTDGSWTVFAAGRFYNASENDLLLVNAASGSIALWRLSGDAFSSALGVATLPAPWLIAGTGDFNHDGVSDILLRNSQTGAVAVWYLNAGTVTPGVVLGTASSNWSIAGVGDINADGYADILWRDGNTGDVAVWMLGGTIAAQTVTGAYVSTAALDWRIAGVADYNGDGRADILLQQQSTGVVGIWLLNGASVSAWGSLGAASSDFQIAATGDFNGDHSADILWHQLSTGAASVWLVNATATTLGNGTAVIGSGAVGVY